MTTLASNPGYLPRNAPSLKQRQRYRHHQQQQSPQPQPRAAQFTEANQPREPQQATLDARNGQVVAPEMAGAGHVVHPGEVRMAHYRPTRMVLRDKGQLTK